MYATNDINFSTYIHMRYFDWVGRVSPYISMAYLFYHVEFQKSVCYIIKLAYIYITYVQRQGKCKGRAIQKAKGHNYKQKMYKEKTQSKHYHWMIRFHSIHPHAHQHKKNKFIHTLLLQPIFRAVLVFKLPPNMFNQFLPIFCSYILDQTP